jgi:hypothetical protein
MLVDFRILTSQGARREGLKEIADWRGHAA